MKNAKASPEIWKNFTRMEKQLWRDVYAICLTSRIWPFGKKPIESKGGEFKWNVYSVLQFTPNKTIEILAHNIACEMVWLLEDHPITKKIKIENGDLIRFKNGSTIKFGSLKKPNRKIRSGDMVFQDDLTGRGLCSKKRQSQKA